MDNQASNNFGIPNQPPPPNDQFYQANLNPPPVEPETKTNGQAKAGFILSLVGLITFSLTTLPGLIFSIIGWNKTSRNQAPGKGLALAGIIISVLTILTMIPVVYTIVLIGYSALQSNARDSARTDDRGYIVSQIKQHYDNNEQLPSVSDLNAIIYSSDIKYYGLTDGGTSSLSITPLTFVDSADEVTLLTARDDPTIYYGLADQSASYLSKKFNKEHVYFGESDTLFIVGGAKCSSQSSASSGHFETVDAEPDDLAIFFKVEKISLDDDKIRCENY